MIFVTDECIMVHAARLLSAFDRENTIERLMDSVPQGTKDIEWLPKLAVRDPKPIVLTGDARILRNKVERAALAEAKLKFVCLSAGWMHLKWEDYAWKIIKAWPEIRGAVERTLKPTVFEVSTKNLKIERLYDS